MIFLLMKKMLFHFFDYTINIFFLQLYKRFILPLNTDNKNVNYRLNITPLLDFLMHK